MRSFRHNPRLRSVVFAAAGLALCLIVPALAQVPPPSRHDDGGGKVPHYVDNADYDRQPYYVDGVEYKPYSPDSKKKAKNAADTVKTPKPQQPDTPDYVTPQPQPETELHPFSQSSASARSSAAASSSSVARAEATTAASQQAAASSSQTPYVPKKRPRYGVAIIEALDKISSESVRFEAPIGQPVRYKGLIYLVKACETAADDESMSDTMAWMTVRTSPVTASNGTATKSKEIFHGWTYASSPGLNPLQHPIYDAWVVGCRKPLPGTSS